jgi:hypothetical protein
MCVVNSKCLIVCRQCRASHPQGMSQRPCHCCLGACRHRYLKVPPWSQSSRLLHFFIYSARTWRLRISSPFVCLVLIQMRADILSICALHIHICTVSPSHGLLGCEHWRQSDSPFSDAPSFCLHMLSSLVLLEYFMCIEHVLMYAAHNTICHCEVYRVHHKAEIEMQVFYFSSWDECAAKLLLEN